MTIAGYNEVVRIPSGATNIDVRQHSYSGKPEDDNYLGKKSKIFERKHIISLFGLVDTITCSVNEIFVRCFRENTTDL